MARGSAPQRDCADGGGDPLRAAAVPKVAIEYGVYGVPETFFIDHTGRIYAKHIGEISWETLEAKIEEGLAQRRQQLGAAGPAVAGGQ